jgi:hypothetical protein
MKIPVMLVAAALAVLLTQPARAGSEPPAADRSNPSAPAPDGELPKTQLAPSDEVRVEIKTDTVIRSCCAPPTLVVSGAITNTTSQPIDFVRLIFSFQDATGKELLAEDAYNDKAANMGADADLLAVMNEQRTFEPLPPGASDEFTYAVPLPLVPRYERVECKVVQTKATPEQLAAARR